MKLLLDEQVTYKAAESLRDRGHDVTAVAETPSLRGMSDREIFDFAQTEQRAIVTYNVADFIEMVRDVSLRSEVHNGLVLVNTRRLPNSDIGGLVRALEALLEDAPVEPGSIAWLQPAA